MSDRRAYHRDWYAMNRERRLAYLKAWREANRDHLNACRRARRKAKREAAKAAGIAAKNAKVTAYHTKSEGNPSTALLAARAFLDARKNKSSNCKDEA